MLTRPTLDSTRESLFNILTNYGLEGASVLDIFAGTGALGLEALSRGAAHCVFIDHYTQRLIQENAAMCGFSGKYEVLRMEMGRALARLRGRTFQYIFADLVIMEHSRHEDISENPLYSIIREKSYGKETRVSFICRRQEGE